MSKHKNNDRDDENGVSAIDLGNPLAPVPYEIPEKPYDPTKDREKKRGEIALILVFTLVGVVSVSFVVFAIKAFFFGCVECTAEQSEFAKFVDSLSELLELIFAPLIGLIGAVTGFYFGEKSR